MRTVREALRPHIRRLATWRWTVDWIVAAGLVLLVAVAYVQVLRFEFVNYDDTVYVPDNPQVRAGFSLGGIGWAFTTFETANWYPLTWLSLMLDCQMFGPRPGGHHAVNAAIARGQRGLAVHRAAENDRVALAKRRRGRAVRRASAARRIGGLDCRTQGRVEHVVLPAHALGLSPLHRSAQFRPLGPGLPGHGLGADGQVDARHPAGRAPVAGLLAVAEGGAGVGSAKWAVGGEQSR